MELSFEILALSYKKHEVFTLVLKDYMPKSLRFGTSTTMESIGVVSIQIIRGELGDSF